MLREDDLRALLATCEKGQDFESRRNHALIRVFIDTGARLDEVAGLPLNFEDDETNDVDLDSGVLRVLGKGRRMRLVPLGNKAVRALAALARRDCAPGPGGCQRDGVLLEAVLSGIS